MTALQVITVLRSGGDYGPAHVSRLRDQVERYLPGVTFRCLTDMAVTGGEGLQYRWPGWWSKMELFRPGLRGSLLYMDLDSAITGCLADMAAIGRLAIMRDVYRPGGLQSSVMLLPERERAAVWRKWFAAPEKWMRLYRKGGDQAFLETLWLGKALRWQDVLPGQVVSWKVDVRPFGRLPEGARFVAFHGQPRPWDVGW